MVLPVFTHLWGCPNSGAALVLVESHEGDLDPLTELVQVPQDGILSFCCVSCTTELCIIYKSAEGSLDLILYVIDKDIKEHPFQDRALRENAAHQPPPGQRKVDHNSLAAPIQPIPNASNSPSFNPFLSNLEIWMSCRTMSKALKRSG